METEEKHPRKRREQTKRKYEDGSRETTRRMKTGEKTGAEAERAREWKEYREWNDRVPNLHFQVSETKTKFVLITHATKNDPAT